MKTGLFVFSLLLSLALGGCGKSPPPQPAAAAAAGAAAAEGRARVELSEDEIRAAGIRVEKLDWQAAAGELAVTGTVQPNLDRYAYIAARVPGRVVRVQASLGERVKPGQPLAVLDSLEVGEARAALAQAEAELKVAQAAYERAASLRAENAVPEKEHLRARGELEKTRAVAAAARGKLRMLNVSAAHEGLASLFVVAAPFAGTIVEKSAVPGALADPAKPLFTVADLSTVWIEANVFEKDLPRLALGAAAAVTVAAWPDQPAKGRVTYLASLLDPATRTVRARIEVANADGRLRPGMFANVVISVPAGAVPRALFVPEDAVVLMDGKPAVFVRGERGFEPRAVLPGERREKRVALKEGVAAGEQVVVAGAYELKARLQKALLGEGGAH